jgi:hypothetical protein
MKVPKGASTIVFSNLEVFAKTCLEKLSNGESISADDLKALMEASYNNKAVRARIKKLRAQNQTVNKLIQRYTELNPPQRTEKSAGTRSNLGSTKSNKPMTTYEKLWGRKPYRM